MMTYGQIDIRPLKSWFGLNQSQLLLLADEDPRMNGGVGKRSVHLVLAWPAVKVTYSFLVFAGSSWEVVSSMDMAEMQRRWQVAKDKLAAARLCHDHGLYGPRSYYGG